MIDKQINAFFYAAAESPEAIAAFKYLESLVPPLNIQQMPAELEFSSHEALHLRSGDLIILFVRDQKDLETLIRLRTEFGNFKIILLFQYLELELIESGQALSPRYYSSVDKKYIHIEETVRKILKQNIVQGPQISI